MITAKSAIPEEARQLKRAVQQRGTASSQNRRSPEDGFSLKIEERGVDEAFADLLLGGKVYFDCVIFWHFSNDNLTDCNLYVSGLIYMFGI